MRPPHYQFAREDRHLRGLGDLPNGVYRFTQTVDALLAADPSGSYAANDEFIGEYVLTDGISELHYFNMDGTPMAGEPPDTGRAARKLVV